MPDREKVIKGFEICKPSKYSRTCGICPYREEMNCDYEVYNDALSLLKEQEAVKPVFDDSRPDVIGTFHCGACHSMLGFIHPFYCPHCGRKVKWE